MKTFKKFYLLIKHPWLLVMQYLSDINYRPIKVVNVYKHNLHVKKLYTNAFSIR